MILQINHIKTSLDTPVEQVYRLAAKKIGVPYDSCTGFAVTKRSVDARRGTVQFVYGITLQTTDTPTFSNDVKIIEQQPQPPLIYGTEPLPHPPVVIGAGPAGLFCAYELAKNGYRPILLERGGTVAQRTQAIHAFLQTGVLDAGCNIQFGEGGAGTFSDGKLTTRIGDPLCDDVLKTLVACGGDEEITFVAKPHIGTDLLRTVVTNLRKKIEQLEGQVHFHHLVQQLQVENGMLKGLLVNGQVIDTRVALFAIGHSARDTYEMLHAHQVAMVPKAFAIGARIEHLQSFVDQQQYGAYAGHPKLGAADYRLAYNAPHRSCFSFCMCPGGTVVAAASEPGGIVVNGMSDHARSGTNANSALVVQVSPADFGGNALDGIAFQRKWESQAYALTGSYQAPAQNALDLIHNRASTALRGVTPTYPLGVIPTDLRQCLPDFVCDTMAQALEVFDHKFAGFAQNAVLTGVETRTSSPLRILRGEQLQSVNVDGLYPVGEGAGYAGGIMSAAVDGIKAARAVMARYAPPA